MKIIKIHPRDNVVVALSDIAAGEVIDIDGAQVKSKEAIRRGH